MNRSNAEGANTEAPKGGMFTGGGALRRAV